ASQNGSPVEINRLFHAALIPSAILIGSFIIYILIYDIRQAVPTVPFSGQRFLKALWNARFEVPIPVLIYGGIYSGLFTVMEAALVIAVYVFIMNFFLYRDFSLRKEFLNITSESMKLSGGIFIIMATAFVLTNFLVSEEIPAKTFRTISPYIKHPAVFLLAINIFLLFVGGLLDIFSAILVVLPILLPIVSQYGVNPYHFAVMFLINLELGYLIPPHGINLFIASYSFKKPITFLYRVSVPFLLVMAAVLLLITYVPSLSLLGVSSNTKTSVGVSKTEPNAITSISIQTPDGTHAILSFTAPSGAKDFTEYQIRYLDSEIKGIEDLDFANEMLFNKALVEPGKTQTLELAPLVPKTKYYFSLRALNKKGESGKWSDILNFTTPEK
ncbi:MAG: TRAP transporter large permease subunit, partial [Spirochaetia bacterium]|nr:TRAP transporter large permease subunit [Spirochaetia bacterium]